MPLKLRKRPKKFVYKVDNDFGDDKTESKFVRDKIVAQFEDGIAVKSFARIHSAKYQRSGGILVSPTCKVHTHIRTLDHSLKRDYTVRARVVYTVLARFEEFCFNDIFRIQWIPLKKTTSGQPKLVFINDRSLYPK